MTFFEAVQWAADNPGREIACQCHAGLVFSEKSGTLSWWMRPVPGLAPGVRPYMTNACIKENHVWHVATAQEIEMSVAELRKNEAWWKSLPRCKECGQILTSKTNSPPPPPAS